MKSKQSGVGIILLLAAILFSLLLLTGYYLNINSKVNFLLTMQQVSRLPTGEMCIGVLGKPMHNLDGRKDFLWYSRFTPLRDEAYMADKKVYMWPDSFNYIIVVLDKENDKVVFTTYWHL